MSPTVKQIETLKAIISFQVEHRRFPSLRELTAALKLESHYTTYDRVQALIKKGLIEHSPSSNKRVSPFSLNAYAYQYVNWFGPDDLSTGNSQSNWTGKLSDLETVPSYLLENKTADAEPHNFLMRAKNAFGSVGFNVTSGSPVTLNATALIITSFASLTLITASGKMSLLPASTLLTLAALYSHSLSKQK